MTIAIGRVYDVAHGVACMGNMVAGGPVTGGMWQWAAAVLAVVRQFVVVKLKFYVIFSPPSYWGTFLKI